MMSLLTYASPATKIWTFQKDKQRETFKYNSSDKKFSFLAKLNRNGLQASILNTSRNKIPNHIENLLKKCLVFFLTQYQAPPDLLHVDGTTVKGTLELSRGTDPSQANQMSAKADINARLCWYFNSFCPHNPVCRTAQQ